MDKRKKNLGVAEFNIFVEGIYITRTLLRAVKTVKRTSPYYTKMKVIRINRHVTNCRIQKCNTKYFSGHFVRKWNLVLQVADYCL